DSDSEWLKGADVIPVAASRPAGRANLGFSSATYCGHVHHFAQAFSHFKRAIELLKSGAEDYDRKGRSQFIDDLIRVYSREAISNIGVAGSSSPKPVFVVGMPRSGPSS